MVLECPRKHDTSSLFKPIDTDQHSARENTVFNTSGRFSGIVHSRLCLFEIKKKFKHLAISKVTHSSFVLGPVHDIA